MKPLAPIIFLTLFSFNNGAQAQKSDCAVPTNLSGEYSAKCEVMTEGSDAQVLEGSVQSLQILQSPDDPCKVFLGEKIAIPDYEVPYSSVGKFTASTSTPLFDLTHSDFNVTTQTLQVVTASRHGDGINLTLSKLIFKDGKPQAYLADVATNPQGSTIHVTCQIGEKISP